MLVLALAVAAAGCRRAQPRAERADQPAPAAAPAPAREAAQANAAPADPTSSSPAPTAPGAASKQPPADGGLAVPVIDLPPPIIRTAEPKKKEEEPRDERLYSWTDEHGSVHFGNAEDVPESRRGSARVVDSGGVTVVPPPPLDGVTAGPAGAPPPDEAAQPADPTARGPEPRRDAQGLPIPGTMDDTAATRASKAAGEIQVDPAAVQRRHEEELRRMNCKEKDGVWFCG